MISNFFNFSVARRGMSAHQTALSVTAHNIANASTQGFSRQQAVFHATAPALTASGDRFDGPGQLGTGVKIAEIRRVRNEFLDYQLRQQESKHTYWQERHEALATVEMIVMEPGDNGLNSVFQRFWGAWHELAKNPTAGAARAAVLETSSTLASTLNGLANQGNVLLSDLNVKTELTIVDVNSLTNQIATLNEQIVTNLGAGLNPNDLLDRRDLLLDELSRLVDFRALTQPNGSVNVAVGGKHLVHESRFTPIQGDRQGTALRAAWPGGEFLALAEGRLAGIQGARDWVENNYLARLHTLTRALHDSVNNAHATGSHLVSPPPTPDLSANFFVVGTPGSEATTIRVNPALLSEPGLIRAAQSASGVSDGSNALAVARLRHAVNASLGDFSIEGYFSGMVTALGVDTQQAERLSHNQEALISQLNNRRDESKGVSIDEELSYMLQFQHGYQASARLLSTLDELLETVINLGR